MDLIGKTYRRSETDCRTRSFTLGTPYQTSFVLSNQDELNERGMEHCGEMCIQGFGEET